MSSMTSAVNTGKSRYFLHLAMNYTEAWGRGHTLFKVGAFSRMQSAAIVVLPVEPTFVQQ